MEKAVVNQNAEDQLAKNLNGNWYYTIPLK